MVVRQGTYNAYYPRPDRGPSLICGSRRIRYCRGFLLVRPKDLLPVGGARLKISK